MLGSERRASLPRELVDLRIHTVSSDGLRLFLARNRSFIAFGSALVAMALGMWGFVELNLDRSESFRDAFLNAFYSTLGLFALDGGTDDPNTQIQIARLIAPLVVGYAALRTLILLFRDQSELLWVRRRADRHVVVVGLGRRGFLLTRALDAARVRVVVVERNPDPARRRWCREHGVPVIVGDATDPEVLLQARCDRALRVVTSCSSDAVNFDVLAACTRLVDEPTWLPAMVQVMVETPRLWTRLQTQSINAARGRQLIVDFAHLPELAGRSLVGALDGEWARAGEPCTLAVVAETANGRAAALHAIRAALGRASAVTLVLCGDEAATDAATLRAQAPWIDARARLVIAPDGHESAAADADAVLVCCADDASGLAKAIELADAAPRTAPVVADVGDDRLLTSLRAADIDIGRVHPVSGDARVLGPDFLLMTTIESIARARHESYLRLEATAPQDGRPEPSASLVPWDELPESLKESNRRFAAKVGAAVRAAGGRIEPAQPGDVPAAELGLEPQELDRLAQAEHQRWMDDLVAEGWRPTSGEKDPVRRLHPLLVPWEQLSEHDRDKDRDSIRSLPRMLAAASFAIRFPDGHGDGRDTALAASLPSPAVREDD